MPHRLLTRAQVQTEAIRRVALFQAQQKGYGRQHPRSPEDQELWDACRWDYALFGKTFLPHWCSDAFNQIHLDYYERLRERQGSRGHHDVTAAPREHSKTTGCCMVSIVHSCVYQTERYTLYITNRDLDAANKVSDIRRQLESNALLLRVFGPQIGLPWNKADFTTCHGQRVRGASRNTQLRGTSDDAQRPTHIFVDDTEHFLRVRSEDQREKDWDWLTKDILHLGEPRTNYEVWGTILHEQGMVKKLLTTPGWRASFYQAVIKFADEDSIPLWQEWRQIFLNRDHPGREEEAQAYFDRHQDAMVRNSIVLWPSRKPYLALMQSRLREGESSFWQELQNQPLGDSRRIFQMEAAAYCSVIPNGIVRAGGTFVPWADIVEIAAAYDPVPDKKDITGTDYAAVPVLAQDRSGYLYVLDTYLAQETSTHNQIMAITDLLWKWDIHLLGVETNGFASLLPADIRETIKQRSLTEHTPEFDVAIEPIANTRAKVLRIQSLETLVANGWLQFAKTLPAEAIRQFAEFLPIPEAGKDDFPDAVEMAIRTIRHQWQRRDMT